MKTTKELIWECRALKVQNERLIRKAIRLLGHSQCLTESQGRTVREISAALGESIISLLRKVTVLKQHMRAH